ncbi:hypothetical protein ACFX2I_026805 [Malus domestica]
MAAVGNLIGGGIVGTLCSELYNLVVTLIKTTNEFSPLLEAIKLTVGGLESLIPQIEDRNEKLKISNKETERLKKALTDGVELVGECSNNPKWYKKAKYTDKLTALDEALERELDMLTAHAASDTKEALLLTRKNHDDLVKLARDGRKGLEMARKHGDQLVELAKDGSETFDTVKEIMNLIYHFLGYCISGLIVIIVFWVVLHTFILLGESKRIATAVLESVLDGIIFPRCKVCKSVVALVECAGLCISLVWTYAKLLHAYFLTASCFFFLTASYFISFIMAIRDQYKRVRNVIEYALQFEFLIAKVTHCFTISSHRSTFMHLNLSSEKTGEM